MVYCQNPAYIKQILVSDSTKFQRPEFFKNILKFTGRTLFSSDGKEHAMQRKMLNPAFSYGNVQKFLPLFNEKALQLVKVRDIYVFKVTLLSTQVNSEVPFCKVTLLKKQLISPTSFGVSKGSNRDAVLYSLGKLNGA